METLPAELLPLILIEWSDRVDRVVFYCVCRLWRSHLVTFRRYCWTRDRRNVWQLAAEAIYTNRGAVARWLVDKRPLHGPHRTAPLLAAARADNGDTVSWLRARGFAWDEATAAEAIRVGYHDALRQAGDDVKGVGMPRLACAAAAVDDPDGLRWAMERGSLMDHDSIVDAIIVAIRSASLRVLDTLCAHYRTSFGSVRVAYAFATAGHVDVIEWAQEKGLVCWTAQSNRNAAGEGCTQVVRWALPTLACPRDSFMLFVHAVEEGQLHTAMWMMENDAYIKRMTIDGDHFSSTCAYEGVAPGVHIDQREVVDALDRICRIVRLNVDRSAYHDAIRRGHKDVVLWLHAYGTPLPPLPLFVGWCISTGHPGLVDWALSLLGCRSPPYAIASAITPKPDDGGKPWIDRRAVVEIIVAHGHEWTLSACRAAADAGDIHIVRMAIERDGAPWNAESCLKAALAHDSARHRRVARWIADRAGIALGAFERRLIDEDVLLSQKNSAS